MCKQGFVYLLNEWTTNKYKLGISTKPIEKRIKSLQTGCSNEIIMLRKYDTCHYLKIEKYLHRKFSSYLCNGGKEWFELPDDMVLNFINECETLHNIYEGLIKSGNPFITF